MSDEPSKPPEPLLCDAEGCGLFGGYLIVFAGLGALLDRTFGTSNFIWISTSMAMGFAARQDYLDRKALRRWRRERDV